MTGREKKILNCKIDDDIDIDDDVQKFLKDYCQDITYGTGVKNLRKFKINQLPIDKEKTNDWISRARGIFFCIYYRIRSLYSGQDHKFIDHHFILADVYSFLEDNTSLLNGLNERQILLIDRFISAIHSLMFRSDLNLKQIKINSGLGNYYLDFIRNTLKLRLIRKRKTYKIPILELNGDLSEWGGIIAGDGNLQSSQGITITLNGVDEYEYVEQLKEFIYSLYGFYPTFRTMGSGKGVQLIIYGKTAVEEMVSFGFQEGDKVTNQISIPEEIKNNPSFAIRCLRGLIDTDGSFPISRGVKKIYVQFSNSSIPLLNDFRYMCSLIGIETTKVYHDNDDDFRGYVRINKKKMVKNFIDRVAPNKWRFRKRYIGINLIYLSDPLLFKHIQSKLEVYKTNLNLHHLGYTKDLENFLEEVCLQAGCDISDEKIEAAIEKSFELGRVDYVNNFAKQEKRLYASLGNLQGVREYLELFFGISPKKETIKHHIEKYMQERGKDFKTWYESICKLNRKLILVGCSNHIVTQFPLDLRLLVIKKIINTFICNDLSKDNKFVFDKFDLLDDSLSRLYLAYKKPNFKKPVEQYLWFLIDLVRLIMKLSQDNKKIIPYNIANHYSTPYSMKQVQNIIKEIVSLL